MDAHVEHDPATAPWVEDACRRRIRVVLAAVEEQRSSDLAGGNPDPGSDVVRVMAAHESDLQPDSAALDGCKDCVGVREVEGEWLLAEDVLTGGRRNFDDLAVVDGRDGDEDRVDPRRGDRVERIREGGRIPELIGQAHGRSVVDVADRYDPQLGRACRDEARVAASHPPGSDDRQADPSWHGSSLRVVPPLPGFDGSRTEEQCEIGCARYRGPGSRGPRIASNLSRQEGSVAHSQERAAALLRRT